MGKIDPNVRDLAAMILHGNADMFGERLECGYFHESGEIEGGTLVADTVIQGFPRAEACIDE
jgi:hypothetical protein